ncbi:hypothetical protein F5144DRAFT_520579 [Chaetomium tenue]|uniref:Uncharacterized protein n=1 Tax=Chaetomium tenue TaxID=1854479 RepID=A0ACB7NYE4_9PEZI|nr:hypothetical protein F5144DRAFT_520579 [Chaetomium globosum]
MARQSLCLSALPLELFDMVMMELDTIRDLANFVSTTRFAYQRFIIQRRTILFRVLENELGPALPDARFLLVFSASSISDQTRDDKCEKYWDWIHVMGGVYRGMLPQNELPPNMRNDARADPGLPRIDELISLCRTLHHVNFLTDTYIATQLGFFSLAGGDGTPATAPPSRPERQRIMRAFYRRQIVSNAWAPTRHSLPGRDWGGDFVALLETRTDPGRRLGLLASLGPWELQLVDHVDHFIMRLGRAIVHRAAEAAAQGRGDEIAAAHVKYPNLDLACLVRYLRLYPDVAAAATDDLQAEREPPAGDEDEFSELGEYLYPFEVCWYECLWEVFDLETDRTVQEWFWISDVVVRDRLDQVPYGWSDAMAGRYGPCYGRGLHRVSPWPPRVDFGESEERHFFRIELWRLAGFALWDQKRIEALKKLKRFENLKTGFVTFDMPECTAAS